MSRPGNIRAAIRRAAPSPVTWLAVAFLLQVATFAARPMVSYRALELGAGPALIGVVAGSYAVLSLVAVLPLGRLIDRTDSTLFIVAGAMGMTVLLVGLVFANSIAALVVIHALLGFAHTVAMLGLQALIAERSDHQRRDADFGTFTAAVSGGQLIGPALAGVLVGLVAGDRSASGTSAYGTAIVFAGAATTALFGTAFAARIRSSRPSGAAHQLPRTGVGMPIAQVLRLPNMGEAILVSVAVLATVDVVVAYLPVYGEANAISVQTITWLLAARAACSLASRVALGWLVRRFGRLTTLIGGMLAPGACLTILPFTTNEWTLLVLVAVAGFGLGVGQPLSLIWVAERAPAGARATALAVRLVGNRLGQVALPLVAGGIAGAASVGAVFGALGVLLFASSAAVWRGTTGSDSYVANVPRDET